ncbi:MAG: hypothetical protein AABX96_01955 [Nanoarchaeota archaeon]
MKVDKDFLDNSLRLYSRNERYLKSAEIVGAWIKPTFYIPFSKNDSGKLTRFEVDICSKQAVQTLIANLIEIGSIKGLEDLRVYGFLEILEYGRRTQFKTRLRKKGSIDTKDVFYGEFKLNNIVVEGEICRSSFKFNLEDYVGNGQFDFKID